MTVIRLDGRNPAHRHYLPRRGFANSSGHAFVPIVSAELDRAAQHYPLAFLRSGAGVSLVAILGLHAEANLFLAEDMRWLGSYVPAAFRCHPFVALPRNGLDCGIGIDAAADRLRAGEGTRRLFCDAGQPSEFLLTMRRFLTELAEDQAATGAAAQALDRAGLLEPWPIRLQVEDEDHVISCYLRVRVDGLAALGGDRLERLHRLGALRLAYGQTMSMENIALLCWLYRMQRAKDAPVPGEVEPDTLSPESWLFDQADPAFRFN